MGIFQFLVFLGIINIVFGFVWKWVFVLPSAILFTAIKFDRGMLLVKAFGAYLLISLTALATLLALQDTESGWQLLFFPIVGAFVLFMGFASNAYEQRKQARMSYDYQLMAQIERDSWFDIVLMLGSLVLFVLILFIPVISANPLNEWLFDVVWWAYELPVIGWLIGIGGVLFMLGIIWHGLVMTLMLGGLAYSKIKGEPKNDVDVIEEEAKDIT
jgi:hypothetical protein